MKHSPRIKFTHYSDRKEPFPVMQSPIVSYVNPKDDLSTTGVSLFSKSPIIKRDIFRKSIVPAGVDYRPNFQSISKKDVVNVKFSGTFGRTEDGRKKKNVKKIFCSYDVQSKFKAVEMEEEPRKYRAGDEPILID